jgi:hypothetical protein
MGYEKADILEIFSSASFIFIKHAFFSLFLILMTIVR